MGLKYLVPYTLIVNSQLIQRYQKHQYYAGNKKSKGLVDYLRMLLNNLKCRIETLAEY